MLLPEARASTAITLVIWSITMRAAVRRRQKISRPGLGEPDDGFFDVCAVPEEGWFVSV